ncbi:MAG: hypothetical protein MJZ76_05805 [Bacteroidales bacterium]|nr:hypothetical protein [Bacteroidales bacterium]
MKKIFLITVFALMSGFAFSQATIDNILMNLSNDKVGVAKKLSDEMVVNEPNNAVAWLTRGNVYLKWADLEANRLKESLKKGKNVYVVKTPDAVLIANECFLKSVTIDPQVKAPRGLNDPLMGQILCGGPIYDMGMKAMKAQEWDKAYEYLNLAAKNFKLDKQSSTLATDLGYIYFDLHNIALQMNNRDNAKQMLTEAMNVKAPFANIYINLYLYNKQDGDTTGCAKVVNAAKKNVPEAEIDKAIELELDYLSMSGQTDKLSKVADKAVKKHINNPEVLTLITGYLIDAKEFEKADSVLLAGNEANPNNFAICSQMGYRYLYEATAKYGALMEEATKAKNWDLRKELDEQRKALFEKALDWSSKAYKINGDDMDNNIRLQQIYVALVRVQDIPEELKAKVESYKKN